MGGEWRTGVLSDFLTLQRGHDLPERDRQQGDVPVMGSAGPNGVHDTALAKGPGVVIGRSGSSFGQVHFCRGAYWPHNTVLYVTDFKGNDPLFTYYYLSNIDFTRFNSGSAQPSLNRNYIYSIPIDFPNLKDQRVIASILSSLDDKIELNRRINKTLEETAQGLFRSWFVDFDPVKAKARANELGCDPERAAMAAIAGKLRVPKDPEELTAEDFAAAESALASLTEDQQHELATMASFFPSAFIESQIGAIPNGWKVSSLGNTIRITGGGTPSKKESSYWGGDIPWFTVKDAPDEGNIFTIDTNEKITDLGFRNSSVHLLPPGTIIISARGTVGKLAIAGVPMTINQSCYGITESDWIAPLYTYFKIKSALEELKRHTHGAVFDTITQKTFNSVFQAVPDRILIKHFQDCVLAIGSQIKLNLIHIDTLSKLRDTLLPKLLSGEVTVGEATEQVEQSC